MKRIIVTGANSGLGLWLTHYLLDRDYRVILACRNLDKARGAVCTFAPLDQEKPHLIRELDLADFASIRRFVAQLPADEPVYGLICNAGLTYDGPFRYTKDGIEETFGVNHLGHFLLTNLLLDKFSIERIVVVSSALHDPTVKAPIEKPRFRPVDEIAHPMPDPSLKPGQQQQSFYTTSKLCNVLFTYELDRRLKARDTTPETLVNAFNPRFMPATNFGRSGKLTDKLLRAFLGVFGRLVGFVTQPDESARQAVALIDGVTTSGGYYDGAKAIPSSPDSYDQQKALDLWQGSERLTGLTSL